MPLASPTAATNRWWADRRWGLIRLLSPLVLLGVWQLGSALGLIPQDVLPAPSLIVEAGIELIENGQLADALRVSGIRVIEGLLLGGFLGVALGTAVGLSRWFEATVDPPMQMIRALPHLGLIPLFILWFGIGELPKVLLVALGLSFPLYLNTFSAVRQVDPKLFETAQVLGLSFWQRFRNIVVPSAAPQVLVGLAVAGDRLAHADRRRADQRRQGNWLPDQQRPRLSAHRHHRFRADRICASRHRHRRHCPRAGAPSSEVPLMTIASERQTAVAGELRHVHSGTAITTCSPTSPCGSSAARLSH